MWILASLKLQSTYSEVARPAPNEPDRTIERTALQAHSFSRKLEQLQPSEVLSNQMLIREHHLGTIRNLDAASPAHAEVHVSKLEEGKCTW
jgi:hypothetical protein